MLVALVKNDKIKLLGQDGVHVVSSYTSLKTQPAVYVKEPLPDGSRAAFFADVVEINGVKVQYDESSKLLEALGPLKRSFNLPQPGDTVVYTLVETDYDEERVEAEVKDLRLHARGNATKSLQVKLVGSDTALELTDIVDIKRKVGNDVFNRVKFQHTYVDYLSYGSRDSDKRS
jgi:hypothetical protein